MAEGINIPVPAGYTRAMPFDRGKHRGLGVAEHAAGFAHRLHAIYLTSIEIPRAALDCPVVFARDAAKQIIPVFLLGVEPQQNLFCDERGNWPHEFYIPAYVRRYPFFLARIAQQDQRGIICVDDTALTKGGEQLIDERGEPTAVWEERQKLIQQLDTESERTREFCAKLEALGILETFDADFHPELKASQAAALKPARINGLMRVGRKSLAALDDATLGDLVRNNWMQPIEAHLNSLARFDRLLNRFAIAAQRID